MIEQNCSKSWSVGFWKSTGMWMYVMPRRLTLAASSGNAFSCVWSPRLTMWRTPRAWISAELRFGRLAGRRYPIVETTPVVDRFRVGHG